MLDTYILISSILFLSTIVFLIVLLLLLLVQHYIYKNIFDPIYFNRNHYSEYELSIFDSFPLLLIKTLGYIKAIVFPSTMRRKFKNNILNQKEHRVIYFLAWTSMLIIIYFGFIIINTFIMGLLFYYYK